MGFKKKVFDHETRKTGLFPCNKLKDFLSSYNQNLKIDIFTPLQQIPRYRKSRFGTLRLISGWRVTFSSCLTSQQHASVSQGRICTDNYTCCQTEIQVADQTFYLTQSQHTDARPTSPSADPITAGAWQDSHWSGNFEVTGMTRPGKNPHRMSGIRTPGLLLSRRTP